MTFTKSFLAFRINFIILHLLYVFQILFLALLGEGVDAHCPPLLLEHFLVLEDDVGLVVEGAEQHGVFVGEQRLPLGSLAEQVAGSDRAVRLPVRILELGPDLARVLYRPLREVHRNVLEAPLLFQFKLVIPLNLLTLLNLNTLRPLRWMLLYQLQSRNSFKTLLELTLINFGRCLIGRYLIDDVDYAIV